MIFFDGLSSDLVKHMMPGKPPGECFDLIKIWIFAVRKQAVVLSAMLSFSAAVSSTKEQNKPLSDLSENSVSYRSTPLPVTGSLSQHQLNIPQAKGGMYLYTEIDLHIHILNSCNFI